MLSLVKTIVALVTTTQIVKSKTKACKQDHIIRSKTSSECNYNNKWKQIFNCDFHTWVISINKSLSIRAALISSYNNVFEKYLNDNFINHWYPKKYTCKYSMILINKIHIVICRNAKCIKQFHPELLKINCIDKYYFTTTIKKNRYSLSPKFNIRTPPNLNIWFWPNFVTNFVNQLHKKGTLNV